ncbi:hypothetical protein EST38_g5429 [Candolleomyces aberdarensis]|uniref:Uncharacterized protein n=1 Tax=Candolleomyces aberdarensis TaxID=2316362 RepID=A0A4Q2DM80_9AGAR|nr:hypothetical protein EST38_g5429 [Candolleomyces aberdarensis]
MNLLEILKAPGINTLDISFKYFDKYQSYLNPDKEDEESDSFNTVGGETMGCVWKFLQDGQQNTLHALRIHCVGLESSSIETLGRINSLKHLSLDSIVFLGGSFLDLGSRGPLLFPNLELLEFNGIPKDFPLTDVRNFIRCRPSIGLVTRFEPDSNSEAE